MVLPIVIFSVIFNYKSTTYYLRRKAAKQRRRRYPPHLSPLYHMVGSLQVCLAMQGFSVSVINMF